MKTRKIILEPGLPLNIPQRSKRCMDSHGESKELYAVVILFRRCGLRVYRAGMQTMLIDGVRRSHTYVLAYVRKMGAFLEKKAAERDKNRLAIRERQIATKRIGGRAQRGRPMCPIDRHRYDRIHGFPVKSKSRRGFGILMDRRRAAEAAQKAAEASL